MRIIITVLGIAASLYGCARPPDAPDPIETLPGSPVPSQVIDGQFVTVSGEVLEKNENTLVVRPQKSNAIFENLVIDVNVVNVVDAEIQPSPDISATGRDAILQKVEVTASVEIQGRWLASEQQVAADKVTVVRNGTPWTSSGRVTGVDYANKKIDWSKLDASGGLVFADTLEFNGDTLVKKQGLSLKDQGKWVTFFGIFGAENQKIVRFVDASQKSVTTQESKGLYFRAAVSHEGALDILLCGDCHDDRLALGRFSVPNHPIENSCYYCHAMTGWKNRPTPTEIHAATNLDCVDCHNRIKPRGKNVGHLLTSNRCEKCHFDADPSFASAGLALRKPDHAEILGSCFICHNGQSVKGKGQNHISSSNICNRCHSAVVPSGMAAWQIPPHGVDHTAVIGTCTSCHNKGVPTIHLLVRNNDCNLCHTTSGWIPTRYTHSAYDLNATSCVNCHNGNAASGKKFGHIPSLNSCEACHAIRTNWKIARGGVNHDYVLGECESCHRKPQNHISSPDHCVDCHKGTSTFAIPNVVL